MFLLFNEFANTHTQNLAMSINVDIASCLKKHEFGSNGQTIYLETARSHKTKKSAKRFGGRK